MGIDEPMTHIVAGIWLPIFAQISRCKEYSLNDSCNAPGRRRIFQDLLSVCQFTFPSSNATQTLWRRRRYFPRYSQDDARDTKDFAKEFGVTFPMLLDDENGYLVSMPTASPICPRFF